jgi:hypothetical protein
VIDLVAFFNWVLLIIAGVGICLSIVMQVVLHRRKPRQREDVNSHEKKKADPAAKLTLIRSSSTQREGDER